MTPLLSVCIRSYNQERFISEALESVLLQKTNFAYEIIVGDDGSLDGTQRILLSFQEQHPEIIKLILGKENVGGPNNLKRIIESSSAKYLAFLDGDDFYTDTYKLQKQVDFLESNEEYVACFHNVIDLDEKTGQQSLFLPLDFPEYHDASSVISNDWFLPIHSVVMRREFISFPDWYNTVMNDDYVINLAAVMHGPYHYSPDIMAVYRHHTGNTSNQYTNQILIDTQLRNILLGFRSIYPKEYQTVIDERISFYDKRIAFNTQETRQPWRKYFRIKYYKRLIRRYLKRFYE